MFLDQEFVHCELLPENIQRIQNKLSNSILCTERFSIDYRKTKNKMISSEKEIITGSQSELELKTRSETRVKARGHVMIGFGIASD